MIFKHINNQKGAFSPFMFGILMGAVVFSVAMNHWAKREIINIEQKNIASNRNKALKIKQALENAILTENIDGDNQYSEDLNLERAQKFLGSGTGKTRSGDDILLNSANKRGSFKTNNKKIIIAASDDQEIRNNVNSIAGTDAMSEYNTANGSVVMFDSESMRIEQIKESKARLEKEASQIYRSYATYGYKFPTLDQYRTQINAVTGNKDIWGQNFKYKRKSDKVVIISFTTPWGYTYKKRLDMN